MYLGTGKGRKSKKSSTAKQSLSPADVTAPEQSSDGLILVDPSRIRFQYSRIRPYFSGCGRSVTSTLDSIRNGQLNPNDLPPIQVMIGPVDEVDGKSPWYFSLNNRRLWVFKRCAEEGLLDHQDGKIWVRVRGAKSQKERERYTLENCAVEAKFIRERDPNAPTQRGGRDSKGKTKEVTPDEYSEHDRASEILARSLDDKVEEDSEKSLEEDDSSSEASSDDERGHFVNRFAELDF